MRRVLPLGLVACFSERPCDERATAVSLAGPGAVDCGSLDPYVGRWDPTARELSEPCMVDAFARGVPFFASALVECEDDTCRWEGRAYDGEDFWILQQWILSNLAFTGDIEVTRCVPALRELLVQTPVGDAVAARVVCEDVVGVDELELGRCVETAHELEGFHLRVAPPRPSDPRRTPVAGPPPGADPSR